LSQVSSFASTQQLASSPVDRDPHDAQARAVPLLECLVLSTLSWQPA